MAIINKNLYIKLMVTSVISLTLISGCATFTSEPSNKTPKDNTPISSDISNSNLNNNNNNNNGDNSKNTPSKQEDSEKILLLNIMKLAKQGKVINSDYPAKQAIIDDVKKTLGEPTNEDWIAAAKGIYATYPKHNLAFGFNKGSQIFEVRSFDSKIKKLSLSKVKSVFGTPAYDVKVKGEEIIGYVAGAEFKILLVFPEPTTKTPDPLMDHYSILYPRGTVNSMAGDPGRQW
ncbi:YjgB family protein [Clostridium sp. BSD9I1]|uniref:YjgB family protein n=1 Tax=Clostridium sp. BSD9I1 TaxID=2003589 RepID=UPI0016473BF3|nr:YjgB family protein [Clostridium sp. BSD9I1]